MSRRVSKRMYLDYFILVPYLFLSVLGIIMVYSASSANLVLQGKNAGTDVIKQALFFMISLLAIAFIYQMKITVIQKKSLIMVAIGAISLMLILTKFTNLGKAGGGADGWLQLGFITIQPVEFLKIIVIWYLAYILSKRQNQIPFNLREAILKPLFLVGVLIFLVLIQPDTGGAAILILISGIMVFSSGIKYQYTTLGLFLGVISSIIITKFIAVTGKFLFPGRLAYVYNRFRVFSNPFSDPYGDGLQMVNSYYAMSNGGWFGLGIGNSIQKKGFLPAAQTDFIFSIVIEELGIIMAIFILLVLLLLILRIFMIGIKSDSTFNTLMCYGIGGMMLIQTFVNIGGITGIIPLTGVTFPFLSQGGSSLLTLSIGVGIALNISAYEKKKVYDARNQQIQLNYGNKQENLIRYNR